MKVRFAYVDRSLESFVIICARCEGWACVRLTYLAALEAKADHDVAVHRVEARVARNTVDLYRRRHADPS